ncbi:hypothetical protein A2368_02730 [Candidatus Collierbacteria bacterium RIFOXYB1_FULL_49_13]|uniref:Uncharacterized protein n=1 Tax=Candidatus Collierbacteria bacterium RIFOXYB1_FULL_49_13 TaxID=1817728 RepID=A0A1F5FJ08_9BACT|nr:MAG: hypothetical protein A2368_02730 [Candidatus Collierbacteria bacterium RIFOXYB1_FULL_49_13]
MQSIGRVIRLILSLLGFPFTRLLYFTLLYLIKLANFLRFVIFNIFALIFQPFNFPTRSALLLLPVIIPLLLILTFYFKIIVDLPSPASLSTQPPAQNTKIFDRHGKLLFELYQDERRRTVTLDDVPPSTINAFLSIEDRNFYSHHGISISGIIRALKSNLSHQTLQGGSTLTQQLVRNTLLTKEKTLTRKVKEIILSLQAESLLTKDQILELYLNQIPFGGQIYGLATAASVYFDLPVRDLSLAQSSFLAGLPQSPTTYSPYTDPAAAKHRQIQVLQAMVESGFITPEEAQAAADTPLTIKAYTQPIEAPHFVMFVRDLLEQSIPYTFLYQGGLNIYTTLDLDLQHQIDTILWEAKSSLKKYQVSNAAALVIAPKTGEILAMSGSLDFFDTQGDGQVNLTTSLRQPGSAVKPITYALALSHGISPSSRIDDSPVSFQLDSRTTYTPKNYDGRFHGNISIRTALASSYNVPAIKLLSQLGVTNMINLAQKMGITTWDDPRRFGLSATLGALEVKMIDLAQVYSVFPNLGQKIPFTAITHISSGTRDIPLPLCIYPKTGCPRQSVIDPNVAFLITDILSDNQARAPSFGLHSVLNLSPHNIAVKTGTSNTLKDNWTIGYTSDYLVATWVGNNNSAPMSHIASGITGASPLWAEIFRLLLKDTPPTAFAPPSKIVEINICVPTQTLACDGCPEIKTEKYISGSQPTTACSPSQFLPSPKPAQAQIIPQLLTN